MSGSQERGGGSNTGVQPERKPDPGPAPVGPAVHEPPQRPVEGPTDPGPAPPGPAVHPERT
ncbi:hypothetical protein [Falsiroseomonas sp.]|jgi:hypothetical protein|uniref:hypothetical protein n=1 Tax=Falsiroseomonas sp. TaxID=2870721 RepID=UPI003F6F5912